MAYGDEKPSAANQGLGERRGPDFEPPEPADGSAWAGAAGDRRWPLPLPAAPPPVDPRVFSARYGQVPIDPPPYPGGERPAGTSRVGLVIASLVAALIGGVAGGGAVLTAIPESSQSGSAQSDPSGPLRTGGFQRVPRTSPPSSMRTVAAQVLPSVVSVEASADGRRVTGFGSGFVFDTSGHILTNNHVVANARQFEVVLSTGRRLRAEIVGADPANDLAVLSVQGLPPDARPLQLGKSAEVQVGDNVLAVGSPLGLAGTVTAGIISAVDREVELGGPGKRIRAFQTDASINPGNSGGPLVDLQGRVVGVNTAIATLGGQERSVGIGFAIPVDRAESVARDIIAGG
jgi:putative serine protease PepD